MVRTGARLGGMARGLGEGARSGGREVLEIRGERVL
jgi:hypothetical protein